MAATVIRYPKGYQFFNASGAVLAGGKLNYYVAGTSSPQNTYADAAGSIANPNPLILDGSGRLTSDLYLGGIANYKELLQDSTGATISPWPDDNIPAAITPAVPQGTSLSFANDPNNAQMDVTLQIATAALLPGATDSTAGVMSAVDKAKLDGIQAGAQVQPTGGAMVTGINTALGQNFWQAGLMTGDSGSGGAQGHVPAPPAGSAAAGKFLRADGTFQAPPPIVTSPNGAVAQIQILEELLTLSGASVNSANQIPIGAIVLGVSTRVVTAVTGAGVTGFNVGEAGIATEFGSNLGLAAGSTNAGIIGPKPYYAATNVLVAAIGGNFSGGQLRLSIIFVKVAPPTS
jgi:hypothetical protein